MLSAKTLSHALSFAVFMLALLVPPLTAADFAQPLAQDYRVVFRYEEQGRGLDGPGKE